MFFTVCNAVVLVTVACLGTASARDRGDYKIHGYYDCTFIEPSPFDNSWVGSPSGVRLFPGEELQCTVRVQQLGGREECRLAPGALDQSVTTWLLSGTDAATVPSSSQGDSHTLTQRIASRRTAARIVLTPRAPPRTPGRVYEASLSAEGLDTLLAGTYRLVGLVDLRSAAGCCPRRYEALGAELAPLLVTLGPPDSVKEEAWRRFRVARRAADAGALADAERELDVLSKEFPKAPMVWHLLGRVRSERGDRPGAARAWREALALLESNDPDAVMPIALRGDYLERIRGELAGDQEE